MVQLKQYSIYSILFLTIIMFNACGTTGLGVNEPHVYLNTFDETIAGVNKALQNASMRVMQAELQDDGDYYVKYFLARFDVDERNRDSVVTAEIVIRKIDEYKTQVRIYEEDQPQMMPQEYKQHLARDVYMQLNKILTLDVPSDE